MVCFLTYVGKGQVMDEQEAIRKGVADAWVDRLSGVDFTSLLYDAVYSAVRDAVVSELNQAPNIADVIERDGVEFPRHIMRAIEFGTRDGIKEAKSS